MGILKQEKLYLLNNISFSNKVSRWVFTNGILFTAFFCLAQDNNMWLLRSRNNYKDPKLDYNYCIDFNYCPPIYHKVYLEGDNMLRKIHLRYAGRYHSEIHSSYCDSSGQFVFTELIGQHYYNKYGKIYDSAYINNEYDGFRPETKGAFVNSNNRIYYIQSFDITYYDTTEKPWSIGWARSDSILICISEFDEYGNLIKKNIPIFKFNKVNPISSLSEELILNIKAKMLDGENIEIFISTIYNFRNMFLHYNLITGKIIKKPGLELDEILKFKYSTYRNKIAVSNKNKIQLYKQANNFEYTLEESIDFEKYPALPEKFTLLEFIHNYCFSPNDSVVYALVRFKKDTTLTNKPINAYLVAFNYYKPYSNFKFITTWEDKKRPEWMNSFSNAHFLKLGPDGNIYGGSGNKLNGNFRITRPNHLKTFKFEWLSDITDIDWNPNYSLDISTLEDYKKTEFVYHPTCDSLKINFINTCDTQHFKRYRLFFDNGDSLDLGKNWRSKIYNYKKTGKYYVRIKAFSKTGGFIWYGDSIEVHQPPIAKFGIQQTKGCQWIGYGFSDSSQWFSVKPGFTAYKRWFLGDGFDTLDASANPKLTYTYTKSDTFTVKLVVNNGYCTDTASQTNNVLILPAPRPGIIADPVVGCTPLKVNYQCKYNNTLDSAVWKSGQVTIPKNKGISGHFIYNQMGNFWLTQRLYDASGCITQDSVLVNVSPGISGMPDILNATVTNATTIDLTWKKHLNATQYSIIKNNAFLTKTTETFYTDKNANTLIPNSYTIKAISMCNDSSSEQDLAKTIYLKGERTEKNEGYLYWTAYQKWDEGIINYQLFTQSSTGNFELMATIDGQTLEFTDNDFTGLSEPQRCYKIIANENNGNLQLSSSNVVCIPLKPILLIPSAFSPNGDGINDLWSIGYSGVQTANLKIFNRWGEIVYYYSAEKPQWDGKYKDIFVPNGAYFYHIEATGTKGEKLYKSGLVEVVR
jgi:gliding motility-associated-like protein